MWNDMTYFLLMLLTHQYHLGLCFVLSSLQSPGWLEQLSSGAPPFPVAEGNRVPHLKCISPEVTLSVLLITHWPERVTWPYSTTEHQGPSACLQVGRTGYICELHEWLSRWVNYMVHSWLAIWKVVCRWSLGRSVKSLYSTSYKLISTNEKRIWKYLRTL